MTPFPETGFRRALCDPSHASRLVPWTDSVKTLISGGLGSRLVTFAPTAEEASQIAAAAAALGVDQNDPYSLPRPPEYGDETMRPELFNQIVASPPSGVGKTAQRYALDLAHAVFSACSALNLDPWWCVPAWVVGQQFIATRSEYKVLRAQEATQGQRQAAIEAIAHGWHYGNTTVKQSFDSGFFGWSLAVWGTVSGPVVNWNAPYAHRSNTPKHKRLGPLVVARDTSGSVGKRGIAVPWPCDWPTGIFAFEREAWQFALLCASRIGVTGRGSASSASGPSFLTAGNFLGNDLGILINPMDPNARRWGFVDMGWGDTADYYSGVLQKMRELGPAGVLVMSYQAWLTGFVEVYAQAVGAPSLRMAAQQAKRDAANNLVRTGEGIALAVISAINPIAGAIAGLAVTAFELLRGLFTSTREPFAPVTPFLNQAALLRTPEDVAQVVQQTQAQLAVLTPAAQQYAASRQPPRRTPPPPPPPVQAGILGYLTHPITLAAGAAVSLFAIYKLAKGKSANKRRNARRKTTKLLREMERPAVLGYELHRDTLTPVRATIDTSAAGDYGRDPLGDGTFRMVPSGDIVSFEESERRLGRKRNAEERNNPRVEKAGSGWVIRFDANTGEWYWTGDTWAGEGRVALADPKVYASRSAALSDMAEATDYIRRWKPGWEDFFRGVAERKRNAKLSARGRHEVARFERVGGETHEDHSFIYIITLMSDGNVLQSHKAKSEWYGGKMQHGGWSVRGRLKAGVTPEQWIANKEAAGWTRVKTRV